MFANSFVSQNWPPFSNNNSNILLMDFQLSLHNMSSGGSSQAICPHSELSISPLSLYSSLHLPPLWDLSYCHRVACLLISLSQYSKLLVCKDDVFFNLYVFKTVQHNALTHRRHSINVCLSNKIIHEVHLLMQS